MTILVFGKTGQVAREIQKRAPVAPLGRDEADLCDPSSCFAAIQARAPDAVINAAAYTAVDNAENEENLATQINGHAPRAMAQACFELDIPFVHISTDYVFDGSGETPWASSDAPDPIGAYGRSKLVGESGIKAVGGRYAIVRTSWVFSSFGHNFLKTMLRLADEKKELAIVEDQLGGPTPAGEIAEACLTIVKKLGENANYAGTYHFSGQPDVSWAEFARAIFSEAGKDVTVMGIPTSEYPTRAARPPNSRLDCRGITETFDLARPDWRDAISRVLRELEGEE